MLLNIFGKVPDHEECVPLHDLPSWIQIKLAEKYRPGLRRIFESMRPVLEALVSIERNLLIVGGVTCSALMDENDLQERNSDSYSTFNKNSCCKAAVDRMISSLELVREFPDTADYNSFSRMVRICRELVEVFSNGVKTLHSHQVGESHPLCREALARICGSISSFSKELSTLENSIEETRLLTESLGVIKDRIVGKTDVAEVESDRGLVLEARATQSALTAARARYDAAKHRAEMSCTDPRLKEGRKLEAERDELASGMDAVLSPFVRISHNIQGKGGTLVIGGELTPEEAACVRKYTGVLTRADMYELLEEEGSIENLLEALFLLGIAGGVGAEPTLATPAPSTVHAPALAITAPASARPPPPAGLSRKSQALLTDALNKFQADRLRCSHAEWSDRRHRLASLERCADYQARRAAAAAAASDLLEEARALDAAVKRAHDAEERGRRAGASLRNFKEHVEARSQANTYLPSTNYTYEHSTPIYSLHTFVRLWA